MDTYAFIINQIHIFQSSSSPQHTFVKFASAASGLSTKFGNLRRRDAADSTLDCVRLSENN